MHQSAVQLAQMRTGMSRTQVTRPHSADFLEYEPAMMSPQTPGGHPGGNSRGNPRHKAQPPRPKSSIEQRMLMDRQTFEESQIRSQSRASGVFDRNYHHQNQQHHAGQPVHEAPRTPVVKYYPPIPSPHDSQLDLASEEVSRYFPTPSPRKSIPQPPPIQVPIQPPQPATNTQIDYQNVPNRRQSTGDYVQSKRAESVTPMV